MDSSIHLEFKHAARFGKAGIHGQGGNNMRATYTMTNLMDEKANINRRLVNFIARAISFFKIIGNETHASLDAAQLAQIARNTRPMVHIEPMIRNR